VFGSYDNAIAAVRGLLRSFFRGIEVTGLEHIPARGGGLFVAFHPNGLIDPALIATSCPRPIVFGARHGLFAWPIVGQLLRAVGTVPIYRAADVPTTAGQDGDAARRDRNKQSLDALAQAVADGSLAALFPEGVSHDSPALSELKVGIAKVYYRAAELAGPGAAPPFIVPVGLYYDDKSVFRSRALVSFNPPLRLPEPLRRMPAGSTTEQARAQTSALMTEIERALVDVVHPTESWRVHFTMQRVRSLVRAERASRAGVRLPASDMQERTLGFERVWRGYALAKQRDPERSTMLYERVELYDAELRTLGLSDDDLDASPKLLSRWLPSLLVLQAVLVYGLLPPILVAGTVINFVPYRVLGMLASATAKAGKDVATVKLFGGLVLFPLTWLAAGALSALGVIDLSHSFPAVPRVPWSAAACTVALGVLGGVLALRYTELTQQTWRSLRIRLTRHRRRMSVAWLRTERAALHDAIVEMADGLPLPGAVAHGGRIVR
jgi:glycerol-3-phosphate O-acyltransferase/dihydroxyacetone phosphate acyltransferase